MSELPALAPEEDELFERTLTLVTTARRDYGVRTALVRSAFDGVPVAVIAAVWPNDEGVLIEPLAILVTPELTERLTDPTSGIED